MGEILELLKKLKESNNITPHSAFFNHESLLADRELEPARHATACQNPSRKAQVWMN